MIVGNVILALIVAGTTGLGVSDTTLLVQASFFIAGIATLMQLYRMWKIGSGLPIVAGTVVFSIGLALDPTATYSQNVGIVVMTKVISKFVGMIAALFMLVA